MNEFEDLARRLNPRRPPAEWRELVLQACRAPNGASSSSRERHSWPGRSAWALLAAIWVALGFLAAAHRSTPPGGGSTTSRAAARPESHIPPDLVAFLSPP